MQLNTQGAINNGQLTMKNYRIFKFSNHQISIPLLTKF